MIALAEVLLEHGADLKAKTKRKCSGKSPDRLPADLSTKTRADGQTQGSDAMDLAARKYHIYVVRALVRAGADPTLPIDGRQSALQMMPGKLFVPCILSNELPAAR